MPVVVDGNNLLHAARAAEDPDLLVGRTMLCDKLGKWAQRRKVRVHVVFDGPAPRGPRASQIGHSDIQVTYSGARKSADTVVIDILNTDSAARRLVIVTTDREIARVAKRRRAKPVRSEVFWAALTRTLARPLPKRVEPVEKEAGLSPEAAQRWAAEFGLSELPDRQLHSQGAGDDRVGCPGD